MTRKYSRQRKICPIWVYYTCVLLLISCSKAPTVFSFKDQGSESLVRERLCLYKASAEMRQYERMQKLWLGNNDGELNLTANYINLSSDEIKAIESLKAYAISRATVGDTMTAIASQIKEIDDRQTEIMNSWSGLTYREHAFVSSLWAIERGLNGLVLNLNAIKSVCSNTSVIDAISRAADDAAQWSTNVAVMQLSILENQRKRPRALSIIMTAARFKLQTEFANKAGLKIGDLQREIDAIIAGADLLGDLRHWWVHSSYAGSNVDYGAYLRYIEPLRSFGADSATLDHFSSRAANTTTTTDIRSEIDNQIAAYRKIVGDKIKELMQKGWRGRFDRQILLVDARLAMSSRYNEHCLNAMKRFKDFSTHVTDIDRFQYSSDLYQVVVDSCNGGQQ